MPANLAIVPLVAQREDFSCGDAATLALLRYWRWGTYARVGEETLYAPLRTTAAKGTDPAPIASYLRALGFDAAYRIGASVSDLQRAVDAREPPIVDLQAWGDGDVSYEQSWDSGHYVVMVGYDDERVFFMDPSTRGRYAFVTRAQLDERWHDVDGDREEHRERMAVFVRAPGREPGAPARPIRPWAVRLR